MNGIVITEENFNWIASKLIKFFNKQDIVSWHSFDCGMGKRVPTKFQFKDKKAKHKIVHHYPYSHTTIRVFSGQKWVRIVLNSHSESYCTIGDKVKFCGNRVQIQSKFTLCGFHYIYKTYQRWDANGGFKDVKPEF